MFKKFKVNHYINYFAIAVALIVFAVLSFTGGINNSTTLLLERIAISIILAVSLSLVVGFLGELSLGHAGFMCIGAYIGGKVSALLAETGLGDGIGNLIISLIVGAVAAGACGILVGIPALRLRGDYLAIVTLAFGEIVKTLFQNSSDDSFGGLSGLSTPRFNKTTLFIVAFVIVLLTLAVVQNFIRSKHGRAVTAVRDNEIAARATGINVTKYKIMVFAISAAFAGIAGVIYSFSQNKVMYTHFDYNYSIEILVMVVLGGMGSINGSIISATLLTFFDEKLRLWISQDFSKTQLAQFLTAHVIKGDLAVIKDIIYALVLIVIVIYNNSPALKGLREKLNLKKLLSKLFKRKHDPSKVKDDAARWDVVPTKIEMDEVLSTDIVVDNMGDNSADIGERGGNK